VVNSLVMLFFFLRELVPSEVLPIGAVNGSSMPSMTTVKSRFSIIEVGQIWIPATPSMTVQSSSVPILLALGENPRVLRIPLGYGQLEDPLGSFVEGLCRLRSWSVSAFQPRLHNSFGPTLYSTRVGGTNVRWEQMLLLLLNMSWTLRVHHQREQAEIKVREGLGKLKSKA
jgi:hypothetical protein